VRDEHTAAARTQTGTNNSLIVDQLFSLVFSRFFCPGSSASPAPTMAIYRVRASVVPLGFRVFQFMATIFPKDLTRGGTRISAKVREYWRTRKLPTDDVGHLCACCLGGSGRKWWNTVAQDSNLNRGRFYRQVEKPIKDFLRRSRPCDKASVVLKIENLYHDGEVRPYEMHVWSYFYKNGVLDDVPAYKVFLNKRA
jgi:hypothetical protein